MQPLEFKGNYIAGEFVKVQNPDGKIVQYSPGDLEDLVFDFSYEYSAIDKACGAAKEAFLPWARLELSRRINLLNKLKDVYEKNNKLIANTISRETGKPLWEAEGEARAMAAKIAITVNHSVELIKEQTIKDAIPGVDGKIWFKPRGVMAVLGPFNFPGHLPNGHIVPALLSGNTIVFKPSEKTSGMGQLFAELMHQAGIPEGVFNVVYGDGLVGKRLVKHAQVDGILFTGSYDVGLKIKKDTINDYWKILALEMGGKNSTIVWEDADLEKAVYETLIGAFLTSGQRCSCTSRIILHKNISEKFISLFHEKAKKLSIGHWNEKKFMGPLISEQSFNAYIKFQDIANREGAESLMRGREYSASKKGYYVTPSINLISKYDPKSVYQNTEIFGPNVSVFTVNDIEPAIDIANASGFGLVTAIFTKQESVYKKVMLEVKTGLCNWNRTTNGASSKLPFGGIGKSGNDRASAHFAVNYCTVPVSSLEDKTKFSESNVLTGVNW